MSDDYTEGPWIVDGLLVRAAETNEVICSIEPWSEDTDAADARLIASAPDLLAALRGLVKVNEDHDGSIAKIIGKPLNWKDDYLEAARAAISRATGEA